MSSSYLEYLCERDLDRRRLERIVRERLELEALDDAHELNVLSTYASKDLTHYLYSKMGLYVRRRFDERKARLRLCRLIVLHEDKVRALVDEWLPWWIYKWRQRVRVHFGAQELRPRLSTDMWLAEMVVNSISSDLRGYYRRLAISALVELNEVCGLDVISDYLLRLVALSLASRYGKSGAVSIISYRPDVMRVEIVRRAVEISRMRQPLMMLKVRFIREQGGDL